MSERELRMPDKRMSLYESCHIDIYAATNSAMMDYPYRLESVTESSPTTARTSEKYILDSHIGNDDVGNRELLERADEIDAQIVIPKDHLDEPMKTRQSVHEFLTLREEMGVECEMMVPLQSDGEMSHIDHYRDMTRKLDLHGFDISDAKIAVGGIKDASTKTQFSILSNVREKLADGRHIHAFGMGCSSDWMKIVRRHPDLIDSLDMSSPMRHAISGKVVDMNLDIHEMGTPRGSKSTMVSVHLASYMLMVMNFMMSENPRDDTFSNEIEDSELEQLVAQYEWGITPDVAIEA